MTEFQERLVEMTQDEIDMALAHCLSDLMDISNATDESYSIVVTPDQDPVLIINGKVSKALSFGKEPEPEVPSFMNFGNVQEQLNKLTVWR